MSELFSKTALKGFARIGDIIIPRNGEFPSFSEVGGLEHIDDLATYAPEDDIKQLNTVLSLLSFMPDFVLRWVVKKMQTAQNSDGPFSAVFRELDVGLRGLIFSCYYTPKTGPDYSGKKPLDIIGWEIKRVE